MLLHAFGWLCLLLAATPVQAAHLKGGYFEYEYAGVSDNNPNLVRYRVRLYQYLECGSAGGQVDEFVYLGIFDARDNRLETTVVMPRMGTVNTQRQGFECISNPPVICYRIDMYETEIELQASNQAGYILGTQRCCRIANIVNIFNSALTGITYSIRIQPAQPDGRALVNSSPQFAQEDTALVCAGNAFKLPFTAADADGDRLSYAFTSGQNTQGNEAKPNPPYNPPFPLVPYNVPFSSGTPMGDEVSIDSNTGVISGIAPDIAGDYVVAVIVSEYRNNVKIGEARKEIHISVGNCDIASARLPSRIVNCDSYTTRFENQSPSSGILSYLWDFGVPNSTTDTSTQPLPTFTYPDTGIYKLTLKVNLNSGCPDSAVTEVRVFPGFRTDFSLDGVCLQTPYRFTDRSTTRFGVVNKWSWDFGVAGISTDVSTQRNPVYVYTTPNTYTIRLISESSRGCVDTAVQTIVVDEKPVVQLAFRDTLICSIDTLQLRALGGGSYVWAPTANMLNANTATPLVWPKRTTTYTVELNDRGCKATDTVRVNVLDFITVDAGNDTTICLTDPVQLNPVSAGLSYLWTPAAVLDDARLKRPTATLTAPATTLYVTANLGKCQSRDSITIRTAPYPTAAAGADTTICFANTATLRANTNASQLQWRLLGSGQLVGNTPVVQVTPAQSSGYVLTVRNTAGCTKPVSDTLLVTVLPRIVVFAGNDTTAVLGQPIQLRASSSLPTVQWSPATGLSSTTVLNPTLTLVAGSLPAGTDTVRYTLTARSAEGCQASDALVVRLFKEVNIFVPSGFTPNADGLNDVLRPVLAGMRELRYFRVFNRYGQLVFETTTLQRGWDGRYQGQLQPGGAYVYQVQAIDYEGRTRQAKGSVVLVR